MLTATPGAERRPGFVGATIRRVAAAGRRPVPADSIAVFRIGFGLLIAFTLARFLAKGWVGKLYLEPQHHLTYRWFGWVEPLPRPLMYVHLAGLAVLGLAIAFGYRHRLAATLFLVGFTYSELIEASLYLNHYWFITVVTVLMLVLPVHHHWSIDARAGRVFHSRTVSAWCVWVLRAQLGIVYVFAGLAKLNTDWMVRAQPMELWLADRTDTPVIGPLLDGPGVAHLASWAGAVFDLTIVGWLLWRRSRPVAYAALVGFHLATGLLFQIGVFPLVMVVCTLVFFEPDWPRRWLGRSGDPSGSVRRQPAPSVGWLGAGVLLALAAIQLWLPMRHYAEPSNVRWSEEGYYLSWRVMLTEKAGFVEYEITDPVAGDRWMVDPSLVLEDWQQAVAVTKPDLIHATALLVADHYEDLGRSEVEVRATAWVTMNGRPAARLIDPSVDLAAHDRGELPAGWILSHPDD